MEQGQLWVTVYSCGVAILEIVCMLANCGVVTVLTVRENLWHRHLQKHSDFVLVLKLYMKLFGFPVEGS